MVRGHPRSSAMSPFDRAHTISYSSLIETMRLSCTVTRYSELFVEIRQLRKGGTRTFWAIISLSLGVELPTFQKTCLESGHASDQISRRSVKENPDRTDFIAKFLTAKGEGYSHILSNNFAVPWGSALGLTAFDRAFRAGVRT